MAAVTEAELTACFEKLLRKSALFRNGGGSVHLSKELLCQPGRPDVVVGGGSELPGRSKEWESLTQELGTISGARILSLLKRNAPRTRTYLQYRSGLAASTVRRCIRRLLEKQLILSHGKESYRLGDAVGSLECELWAFELKVSNWKRALYQACRYRAFSHRAAVVIWENSSHVVEANVDVFKCFGISVFSVDYALERIRVIYRAPKARPASRFHYYYALGKFLMDAGAMQ